MDHNSQRTTVKEKKVKCNKRYNRNTGKFAVHSKKKSMKECEGFSMKMTKCNGDWVRLNLNFHASLTIVS